MSKSLCVPALALLALLPIRTAAQNVPQEETVNTSGDLTVEGESVNLPNGTVNSFFDKPRHANGLVYDDDVITRLRAVVDSLHGAFTLSEQDEAVLSPLQAMGTFYRFEFSGRNPDAKEMRRALLEDLKEGVAPDEVEERYRDCIDYVRGPAPILLSRDGHRDDEQDCVDAVAFLWIKGDRGDEVCVEDERLVTYPPRPGEWFFNVTHQSWDQRTVIRAYYIAGMFASPSLPDEYARLVRYADHMIEPASYRIDDEADTADRFLDGLSRTVRAMFDVGIDSPHHRWVDNFGSLITTPEYNAALAVRKPKYMPRIAALLREEEAGRDRFPGLRLDSIEACMSQDEVADYVEREVSAELALELYRRYQRIDDNSGPVMMCGTFASRMEARRIEELAGLAAEAGRWDVFLRAELSTALYVRRGTHGAGGITGTSELEATGVNLMDLLFGMLLGSRDAKQIGMHAGLGFALAQMDDTALVERRIMAMISDERLDPSSRSEIFGAYLEYVGSLPNGQDRIWALYTNYDAYPGFMQSMIRDRERYDIRYHVEMEKKGGKNAE